MNKPAGLLMGIIGIMIGHATFLYIKDEYMTAPKAPLILENKLKLIAEATKTPQETEDTRLDSVTAKGSGLYLRSTLLEDITEFSSPTLNYLRENGKLNNLEITCRDLNTALPLGATYYYDFFDKKGAPLKLLSYTIVENDCINIEATKKRVAQAKQEMIAESSSKAGNKQQ